MLRTPPRLHRKGKIMIRVLTATLFTLCVATTAFTPVLAQDSKDSAKDPAPAKETKMGSKASSSDVNLGARMAGFTAGVVFGVPVAIVRRTGIEIKQGVKDLAGDTDNWFKILPASCLAVPFGGVSGGAGGVMYGVKNAWKGAGDEPFGKDTFSMGDNVD